MCAVFSHCLHEGHELAFLQRVLPGGTVCADCCSLNSTTIKPEHLFNKGRIV